jgi:hypothetical protein
MSEPSSKLAKGSLLMGVAAIITAAVPLIVGTAGERADKADDKAELVMALIKQHLVFLEEDIDELKQDNRELRSVLRRMYTGDYDSWMGEGAAEPEPPPPPPGPVGIGGGGDDELKDIEELLEERPPKRPSQQKMTLPSPEQLDALLD